MPKLTRTTTEQERRENSGNSGRGKAKTQWEQNGEWREERAESHAGDLRERAGRRQLGEDGGPGEGRHTSITGTNRLPSALVAVPSLSKLKNKGRDNREQLVTLKNLKSRMLLAT